ncbi:MAG: hypothetical protein ACRCS9_14035 [Hyphomicrobium sp.]
MPMKPTPTKVVLLMSAAGLGMSLPGLALASRDNDPTDHLLRFGAPSRTEPACHARSLDALASCTLSGAGESQSLFLASADRLNELKASFSAMDSPAASVHADPAEAAAGRDGLRRDDEGPVPQPAVLARVTDRSHRDPEQDAPAAVWLESSTEAARNASTNTNGPARPVRSAPVTLDQAAAELSDGGANHQADQRVSVAKPALAGKVEPGGLATHRAAQVDEAAPFDDMGAKSPNTVDLRVADGSGVRIRVDATTEAMDSASLDSVWAALTEVLGSQLDEPSPAVTALRRPVEASKSHDASGLSAARVALDPVLDGSASTLASGLGGIDGLWGSSEVDPIVVASSHSEKILLSLAALRSPEALEVGSRAGAMKKTIVVGHTEKVLEALTLFQPRKSRRVDLACARLQDDSEQDATQHSPVQTGDAVSRTGATAIDMSANAVDIPLQLSPPHAARSAELVPRTEPTSAVVLPMPSAGRVERHAFGRDTVALSGDRLNEVRGGFTTDTGLKVSFGIERAVYLNGNLVTTTSLNIADLSKISGGQAQVTGTGTGSLAIVQSGAGNLFSPTSISSTAAGTVIQNTLDNQKINTVTRIDAVVNSAGIMRSINLQSSMRSAVIDSLRR